MLLRYVVIPPPSRVYILIRNANDESIVVHYFPGQQSINSKERFQYIELTNQKHEYLSKRRKSEE